MSNLILAFPNRGDEATLSGGSWQSTLPLANLKNRLLAKKARSTNLTLANTQFDVALTKGRPIRVVVLVSHNLSVSAQYRIRGATVSDFSSTLHDSGWRDVWPAIYPSTSLEWEDDNYWDGKLSAEDRALYPAALIHVLDAPVSARYWRVEIDDEDPANADGYVEAGRLFMAGQWQVAVNYQPGSAVGWEDPSVIETALGGQEYFDERSKYRVMRFELGWLDDDDAYARALEAQLRLGITGEAFLIPDPDDATHLMRRAFLCRMRRLSALEHPYPQPYRMAFEAKEII